MEVKIIRSPRRRRTISARMVKECLIVSAPHHVPQERLDTIIDGFKIKFQKRRLKEALDRKQRLCEIAARLNEKYFANALKINSIEYVIDQNSKYGCCNYTQRSIRISHKVGLMPSWVRDYVLIHEMAHLLEPNHGKAFWDIVSRYELAERARGYLLAMGFLADNEQENLNSECIH
jgi:hypothetical protein